MRHPPIYNRLFLMAPGDAVDWPLQFREATATAGGVFTERDQWEMYASLDTHPFRSDVAGWQYGGIPSSEWGRKMGQSYLGWARWIDHLGRAHVRLIAGREKVNLRISTAKAIPPFRPIAGQWLLTPKAALVYPLLQVPLRTHPTSDPAARAYICLWKDPLDFASWVQLVDVCEERGEADDLADALKGLGQVLRLARIGVPIVMSGANLSALAGLQDRAEHALISAGPKVTYRAADASCAILGSGFSVF